MNYLSKIKKDGTFGENTMTETQLRNLALDIKDECHNIMLGFKKEISDGRMRSLTPKELRDIRLHNVKKLNAEGLRGVYEKLCDELESTPDVLRAFALEIFKLSPVGTSDNAVKTANSIMQQLIDEDLMMYYFAEEHKSIKDVRELTGFTAAKVSKAAERARKAGIEVPMAVRPKRNRLLNLSARRCVRAFPRSAPQQSTSILWRVSVLWRPHISPAHTLSIKYLCVLARLKSTSRASASPCR